METKEAQRGISSVVIPVADQLIFVPRNFYLAVQSAVVPNGREYFDVNARGIFRDMRIWSKNTFFKTAGELLAQPNFNHRFNGVHDLGLTGGYRSHLTPSSTRGALWFWSYPSEKMSREFYPRDVKISNIASAKKGLISLFKSLPASGNEVIYEIQEASIYSLKFKPPSEMNYTKLISKLENPWLSSGINGALGGGMFGCIFAILRGDDFRDTCVSIISGGIAGFMGAGLMSFATDQSLSVKALFFASSVTIGYLTDWGIQAVNMVIG